MLLAVAGGAGAGALIDLRTRRIPNAISVGLAALGVVLAAGGASGTSVASSLAGFFAGLLLMMPGHLLGATGAGDVKLFAAVGAVVGLERIVGAFLWTAVAGGVLALAVAAARGRLGATLARTARLVGGRRGARREIEAQGAPNRFAYGPAIAIGGVLSVLA
jgi:prepilin peptidase CpaA